MVEQQAQKDFVAELKPFMITEHKDEISLQGLLIGTKSCVNVVKQPISVKHTNCVSRNTEVE